MSKKIAWVLGSTGLVGSKLVEMLAETQAYDSIYAMVRSVEQDRWSNLHSVEQWQIDFDDISSSLNELTVDHLFCAIGSTAKKTPDKSVYYKIDVEYPIAFAKEGLKRGMKSYGVVSAHGANAASISSYLKMKGVLEKALQQLSIPNLSIARPGLLLGNRSEFRFGEKAFEHLAKHLPGNYRAISADDVSAALIASSNHPAGLHILSSRSMQGSAKQ